MFFSLQANHKQDRSLFDYDSHTATNQVKTVQNRTVHTGRSVGKR